jgi:hypothetical protein
MSYKQVQCSFFPTVKSDQPTLTTVYDFLTGNHFREQVEAYRKSHDKTWRTNHIPAITPSSICRGAHAVFISHTRLICIDGDEKDNPHITDWPAEVERLKKSKHVVFAGISSGGKGFFAIIAIAYPEKHTDHFLALEEDYADIGITLDPACRDVNRPRFASINDETTSFWNNEAEPYTRTVEPKKQTQVSYPDADADWKVQSCVEQITAGKIDITAAESDWFDIGCAFANTYGESGRGMYHKVSAYFPQYRPDETDEKYSNILKNKKDHGKTIATFFAFCADHGISYKNQNPVMELPDFLNHVDMENEEMTPELLELTKQRAELLIDKEDGTIKGLRPRVMAGMLMKIKMNRQMADDVIEPETEDIPEGEPEPLMEPNDFLKWYRKAFDSASKTHRDIWKGEGVFKSLHSKKFPVNIYPKAVRDFIACQTVQKDFVAVGILSAIAVAIGKTAKLSISTGREYTTKLNICLIGISGQKKSPALDTAYSAITFHDMEADKAFKAADKQWKADKKAFDDSAEKKGQFQDPKPVDYQIVIDNITMAMIGVVLSRNLDGCVIKKDELRGLFKKMSDTSTDDIEQYIQFSNNNSSTRIQRKGGAGVPEQDTKLDNPHLGVVGTTQPKFLAELFGGQNMDNGMGFRYLYCFPEKKKRQRDIRKDTPADILSGFKDFFAAIFKRRTLKGESGASYEVSPEVWKMYEDWEFANATACEGDDDKMGFWEKYNDRCLRLALVLQVMADSQDPDCFNKHISEGCMRDAMALIDYFIPEAWEVLSLIRGTNMISGPYAVVLNALPATFTTAQAEKIGGKYHRSAGAIKNKLGQWVTAGYLERRGHGVYVKS